MHKQNYSSKMNDSSNTESSSYFEIREFISDDGEIVRSEVSDLSKEMIKPVIIPEGLQKDGKLMNDNTELQERISDHLKKVGLTNTKSEPDEHTSFVRELAMLSHSKSGGYVDEEDDISDKDSTQHNFQKVVPSQVEYTDVLSSLILQEEQSAASRLEEQRTPIAGKGWKKGFFGQKDNKTKKSVKGGGQPLNITSAPIATNDKKKKVTFNDAEPSPSEAMKLTVDGSSTKKSSSSPSTTAMPQTQSPPLSQAFTGTILERFP